MNIKDIIQNHAIKVWYGVKGVARPVCSVYFGILNKAKQLFANGNLLKVGTFKLSSNRSNQTATSVGNYALFTNKERMDAINNAFTMSIVYIDDIYVQTTFPSSLAFNDYALIGGGIDRYSVGISDIFVFDASLIKTNSLKLSSTKARMATAAVGNYALFGLGAICTVTSSYGAINTEDYMVDAFDTSLTKVGSLSTTYRRDMSAATTVGDYALFGGGFYNDNRAEVTAITSELTVSSLEKLTVGRYQLSAATAGDYAIFAGGVTGGTSSSYYVDIYDSTLTKLSGSIYFYTSSIQGHCSAISLRDHAIFAGGSSMDTKVNQSSTAVYNTVMVIDENLTVNYVTPLSTGAAALSSTALGRYGLFGGGIGRNGNYNITLNDLNVYKL